MRRILRRTGWATSLATFFSAAMMAAGMSFVSAPAQAAFELPEGEKITNVPAIPRNIPQKEAYELYDPRIGKNFDLSKFWLRADLRVRPEWRNGVCFGGSGQTAYGACNAAVGSTANGTAPRPGSNAAAGNGIGANNSFVQQWVRLGVGYDLSPDVNFYTELIYSNDWGTSANPAVPGQSGGPALNNNCGQAQANGSAGCSLGVRAAYMLVRNLADVQGLSMKAGRQYLVFGAQSLFGHFDWANTGFSHDGVMFQYSTKPVDIWAGLFRESDQNIAQAASTGSFNNCAAGANAGCQSKNNSTVGIIYTQIKSVPGFIIEPHYFLYMNSENVTNGASACTAAGAGSLGCGASSASGDWIAKSNSQIRNTVGNRVEMRKGNFDFQDELEYQFGRMASGQFASNAMNMHINAWATRNWLGYTFYQSEYKPRIAVNFDYASGDGNANCNAPVAGTATNKVCTTANTFENLYPTNHIHMGYMDVQSWRNMLSPSANFQIRPTKNDHFEIWYTNLNLANSKDNWYRGSQTVYVFSKATNSNKHIGDEVDFTLTHMFADGKVAVQVDYSYLWIGDYIKNNLGNNSNQQWAYISLWTNF
ncbi:MAG TPA: alginate export family protein [Nitrospiraceae bacterium]|nr:alginate export family protein [Nitrospiraceae bacterium]